LAYCHLPTCEPPWSESGWISHDPTGAIGLRLPHACAVHVARGDYVASFRLPLLPSVALVEWLGRQRCEIDLHHLVRHIRPTTRT
jgi:hypothetical protein